MTLETRDRWVRAAEGWEARADQLARDTMPVSARMVEADRAPARAHGARPRGRARRHRLPRRRADPARRHAHHQRLRARDARRRAKTGGAQGHHERPLQADRPERPDRPARREPRRGPVPLGLHAARGPRVGAARHPPRAQAGRAALALAAWTGPDDNLWSAAPVRILPERGHPREGPARPRAVRLGRPERHHRDDGDGRVRRARGRGRRLRHALRRRRRLVGRADPAVAPAPATPTSRLDFATRSDVLADLEAGRGALHAARRQPDHPRPHVDRDGRPPKIAPPCTTTTTRIWTCSRARPWPSWATAPRATPTPGTSRTPG